MSEWRANTMQLVFFVECKKQRVNDTEFKNIAQSYSLQVLIGFFGSIPNVIITIIPVYIENKIIIKSGTTAIFQ